MMLKPLDKRHERRFHPRPSDAMPNIHFATFDQPVHVRLKLRECAHTPSQGQREVANIGYRCARPGQGGGSKNHWLQLGEDEPEIVDLVVDRLSQTWCINGSLDYVL